MCPRNSRGIYIGLTEKAKAEIKKDAYKKYVS